MTPAERIRDLFDRIDRREIELLWLGGSNGEARVEKRLHPTEEKPGRDYAWFSDYPQFRADGWTICVFDDAGGWDYVEWVESPEGVRVEYQDSGVPTEVEQAVMGYNPKHYEDWGY